MIRVYDWINSHSCRTPDKLAMVDWHTDRRITYSEMNKRVASLSGFLKNKLGVEKRDRVAVLGFNSSDIFELQFACFRIGAIFTPLNIRLALPELEFMINDLEAKVLFHGVEFRETGDALKRSCNISHLIELNGDKGNFESAVSRSEPVWEMVPQTLEDTCTILYTSGTTGRPKGACITHGSVLFNAVNLGPGVLLTQDSTCLCILPMFHVSGLNVFGNPIFHAGGTNVIVRNFDAPLLLKLIGDRDLRISHFIAVPTIYQLMAIMPEFANTDFSRIVCASVGGAPSTEILIKTYAAKGVTLYNSYGMTETGPTVLLRDRSYANRKYGSVGRPALHMEVKLKRLDGRDAENGEVGEIWVRGPSVIQGYWKRSEANKTDITDGWLHTGDAAYCDDEGDFFIVDRWKDMYISGGENVYPAEVENVISMLPEVMMVAVIGIPDAKWGETGAAYIVLKEGCSLDREQIKAHCLANLAKYKIPTIVQFVPKLPLNATGKIRKQELKEPEWRQLL